jgi:hypothetical protein
MDKLPTELGCRRTMKSEQAGSPPRITARRGKCAYLIVLPKFSCCPFGFELYFLHLNLSGGYSEPMNGNPKLHLAYYAAADSRRQGERVSIRF